MLHTDDSVSVGCPSAIVLYVGFRCGWYAKEHVAAWADHQITRLRSVPSALIELALVSAKSEADIGALLVELAGPFDGYTLACIELGFVLRMLRSGELLSEEGISRAKALIAPYPPREPAWPVAAEAARIGQMDDTVDLIDMGILGPSEMQDVAKDLSALLRRFEIVLVHESRRTSLVPAV
jgi:hypothetical protein